MVEVDRSPDIIFPKYRDIVNGIVINCPLRIFDTEEVSLVTCKKCKNFIRVEDNKVLCAVSWI
ncbi:MAG: hypothetical protein ACP5NL_02100 [Thermoplasmata archaeon]